MATFSLKIKRRQKLPADVLNFLDPQPLATAFNLPAEQALDYYRKKGLKVTFDYRDMIGQEHDLAFTVAAMADADMLKAVRDKLDEAIATGKSMADFRGELTPLLQQKGWWGGQQLFDPKTGLMINKQLGSPHRLNQIFRTNLVSSYQAGHWEQIERQKEIAPFLMYDAVDDGRTRPEHIAWDKTVLPVDSPFWDTHHPTNGYNCRCGTIQLDQDDLDEMGITPSAEPKIPMRTWTNPRTEKKHWVPEGIDPGWSHNPGKARLETIKEYAAEKLQLFPADMVAAIKRGTAQERIRQSRERVLADITDLKPITTEQDALLSLWEQAMVGGYEPSKRSQAEFDALPAIAKKAILAEIERIKDE